jgi:membrane-associated phospholipid phosphatase
VTRALPIWEIYLDLLTARMLLGIAPRAAALLSAEDHRFLAERYAQLAARWRRLGWLAHAEVLARKAEAHIDAAGGDDLPPAVAAAMPRPRPALVVEARGRVMTDPRAASPARPRPLHPFR